MAADDVNVQLPISVAATLCGVGVNVLASATNIGDVDCTTEGVAVASRGRARMAENVGDDVCDTEGIALAHG